MLILGLEKVFCAHKNYKFRKPKHKPSPSQGAASPQTNSSCQEGEGEGEGEGAGPEDFGEAGAAVGVGGDSARTDSAGAAQEQHDHAAHLELISSKNWVTPVLLLVALSVHSLFEGLALGVSRTGPGVAGLLFGIAIHKWAASFSIVSAPLE